MATCRILCIPRNFRTSSLNFSTSSFCNNKWRVQKGLEKQPRKFGPLKNLPDYSFLDGRTVPLSNTKRLRLIHQQELCKKIVELSHELDVGLELYHQRKAQEKENIKTILKNKLKPKGAALLAKNKKS